jgi:hypothetical protein
MMLGLIRTASRHPLKSRCRPQTRPVEVEWLEDRRLLSAGLLPATSSLLANLTSATPTPVAVHLAVVDTSVNVSAGLGSVGVTPAAAVSAEISALEQPVVSTKVAVDGQHAGILPVDGQTSVTVGGSAVQVQASTGSNNGGPVVTVGTSTPVGSGGSVTPGLPAGSGPGQGVTPRSGDGGGSVAPVSVPGTSAATPATPAVPPVTALAPVPPFETTTGTAGGGTGSAVGAGAEVPTPVALPGIPRVGATTEDSGTVLDDDDQPDPQAAELITGVEQAGHGALGAILQDAVGRADHLAAQVTNALTGTGLAPWLLAAAAAAVAVEVARRRLRETPYTLVADGEADIPFPGESS